MKLSQRLNEDMKTAMRGRHALAVSAIRMVKSAIKNAAIFRGVGDEELTDSEVIVIIRREIQKRQDAIEQYLIAGRTELVEQERVELDVLRCYMPEHVGEAKQTHYQKPSSAADASAGNKQGAFNEPKTQFFEHPMNEEQFKTQFGCELPILISGLEFDHLPDFLSDHTLMADAPSDRITEHARRWTQFVAGLWCDSSGIKVCYQLRYQFIKNAPDNKSVSHLEPTQDLSVPTDDYSSNLSHSLKGGKLRLRLIIRVDKSESAGGASTIGSDERQKLLPAAHEHLKAVKIRLMELGFTFKDKVYDYSTEKTEFMQMKSAYEVRQREMMIPIKNATVQNTGQKPSPDGRYYMVEPWMSMAGPFLMPIQILCAQSHNVWICINLRPLSIASSEIDFIASQATFGATNAGIRTQIGVGDSGPALQTTDPQAGWFGEVYSSQLRRLSRHIFGCSVLVVSTDKTSSEAMAAALASSISTEMPLEGGDDLGKISRSGAEVVSFDNMDKAFQSAVMVRFSLNDSCRKGIIRPQAFHHLRYAVDPAGAATVFRLPVNIRGGVPGIAVRQIPPDFNPGLHRSGDDSSILIGVRSDGGEISVPVKDFAKHALITGFTGTGKTNTVLHLLDQFWRRQGIPFLVIESAKAEYRGFIRVEDIPGQKHGYKRLRKDGSPMVRIYTVGNESCSPLRLNPFELQPGVRLESHISRLQACFEAAIPQGSSGGPVPSLLADALPMIYQEKGWSLLDEGYPRDTSPLLFPTMADLKEMLLKLLKPAGEENGHRGRGYSGEVLNNLKGFILGRVGALLQGSRGLMFGAQYSVPLDELFSGPAIIELNDLNEADKGLVVMFLLVMLREYREKNPIPGGLGHITVVEEAHNVLSNPAPGTASEAQEKAVQAFCNMLAEIRSLGEGLIIADQSPQKLARDAIRNTNVQITHALRDSHDRDSIADCSLMTDEQRDYLGKIRTGWAATFFMGLEKATFVKVPGFAKRERNDTEGRSGRGKGFASVTDEEVRKHMQKLNAADRNGPLFNLCEPCQRKCEFRKAVLKGGSVHPRKVKELTENLKVAAAAGNATDLIKRHAHASAQLAVWSGLPGNSDTLWCAAAHVAPPGFFGLHRKVDDHHRALCNSQNGFAWALGAYPPRLQHEQRNPGNHA